MTFFKYTYRSNCSLQLTIADLQGIYKRYRELKRKSIDEGNSQQSGCSLIDVAEPMKEIMPPRPVSDDDDDDEGGMLSPGEAGDAAGNASDFFSRDTCETAICH